MQGRLRPDSVSRSTRGPPQNPAFATQNSLPSGSCITTEYLCSVSVSVRVVRVDRELPGHHPVTLDRVVDRLPSPTDNAEVGVLERCGASDRAR